MGKDRIPPQSRADGSITPIRNQRQPHTDRERNQLIPNAKKRQSLTRRVLRDGLLFSFVTTLVLVGSSHSNWAISYLWGAFLSLFSMVSLMVVAPRLLHPKAPQVATFLLTLLLFLKLPFYGVCLFWAINAPGFNAFMLLGGAVLVPVLIFVDTLGSLMPEHATYAVPASQRVSSDLQQSTQRLQQLKAELMGERG